jgi:hypothetical protein
MRLAAGEETEGDWKPSTSPRGEARPKGSKREQLVAAAAKAISGGSWEERIQLSGRRRN